MSRFLVGFECLHCHRKQQISKNLLAGNKIAQKGVPGGRLFYYVILSLLGLNCLTPLKAETVCLPPQAPAKQALIKEIVDGDTVRLQSGQLVRLVGINAPERGYGDKPDEALAQQAREFLQNSVSGPGKVGLVVGTRVNDRYGRELAHLILSNGENVQQLLLRNGLAFHISFPPNLLYHKCYAQAQAEAKKDKVGIWALPDYEPINAERVIPEPGFKRIVGRVKKVNRSRHSIWLEMGRAFAVRIRRQDLEYFKNIQLDQLRGQWLEVSGWVRPIQQQKVLLLRHPAAMTLVTQ